MKTTLIAIAVLIASVVFLLPAALYSQEAGSEPVTPPDVRVPADTELLEPSEADPRGGSGDEVVPPGDDEVIVDPPLRDPIDVRGPEDLTGDLTDPVNPTDPTDETDTAGVLATGSSAATMWVSGYVASWTLNMGSGTNGNYGNMPYRSLDLDALTHVIMFAAAIGSNGSVTYNSMVSSRRRPFNDYVHSKGKPILMSIGGAGNTAFSAAMSSANRTALVRNLLNSIRTEQYDGIDIDIEPVSSGDASNIRAFVRQLYDSLQTMRAYYDVSKRPILTCAVYNQQGLWAELSPYFDQVNLMSYDFFGTWFGKAWHNNAPYGGAGDNDIGGSPMTTVQNKMQRYLNAGIPASKFGVGVDFNGYVWRGGLLSNGNGVTAPRQQWVSPPVQQGGEIPGWQIVRDWVERYPSSVRFDNVSKVPYVGVDNSGSASDYYVTYEDTTTVKEIIRVARSRNLGGVILWEIGGGFLGASQFPTLAVRDPLLQAVKREVFGGGTPPPPPPPPPAGDTTRPTVAITGPSSGAVLSGTVTLTASASDNVGVTSVQFFANGTALGSALTSAPWSLSWSTTLVTNGSYAITAVARDAAGNSGQSSPARVAVQNASSGSADRWIYRENLEAPWIRTSWNATVTFESADYAYSGSKSTKVEQGTWGSFSVHSGSWAAPVAINTAQYGSLEFAVFGGASGLNMAVMFENDQNQNFPTIDGGFVSPNTWGIISIPTASLNPNGYPVHRVDIMEKSGSPRVYYVDDLRFVGGLGSRAGRSADTEETFSTPFAYELSQNYPNPFNPSTVIAYSLAREAQVTLEIYNALGQSVQSLVSELQQAGRYETRFEAASLAAGVYFYRLTAEAADGDPAGSFVEMRKMVLMK